MEQRIGSNSQPLDVAAVDPAFIPGLTPTVSAEPKSSAEPEGAAEPEKTAEVADEASPEDKTSEEAPAGEAAEEPSPAKDSAKESSKDSAKDSDEAEDEPAEEADDEADSEAESEGPDSEGPAFEASDRRASIVADRRGVRLRLDDQEAEFRWDEIGAVETESPRFGKRFTITVHTPDRRWYPIEIEASARSRFKEWETKLDEVLDAYFQE
ncbi:hypothetical protein [Streptomyces avermitilis]|uniref:hypothetical protein n=1 Tax=Streptomyces avermitilis TaxID=33903 RepID=UPI0033FF91DD